MIDVAVAGTLGLVFGLVSTRPRAATARPQPAVVWDPSPRTTRRVAPPGTEVVYLVRAGATNRVKVGTTTSWPSRVRQLSTGMLGERPRLEGLIPGGRELEQRVHRALREHRVRGDAEWFTLEPGGAWRQVVEKEAAG